MRAKEFTNHQSVAESKDWRGLPYQGPIKTRGLADALHNWFRMWETDKSVDTILSSPEAQPFKVPPKNIGALYRAIVPGDKDTNEIKSGGKLVAFATDIKGAQQFIKTVYPEDSDRYVIIKKTFRPQDFLLDFTAMFETYDEWALGPHYTGEYEVWMKSTPYYTSVKTSEIVYEYDPDKIQGVAEERLDEVPLPADWDPEKLNLRQTYKDRLKYALDRAKRLGGGSSRVAMTIDYEGRPTVLKVAKNAKGLAQNEAEVEILLDGYSGKLPIVIPLIDYDKANKRPVWLQTEIAKKIQAPTLMKLLRTPSMWLFMNQVRNLVGKKGPYDKDDNEIKQIYFQTANKLWQPTEEGYEIFRTYADELAELGMSSTIELGDFNNPSNWGVYNNRPVVLDLGFTEDTAQLYAR